MAPFRLPDDLNRLDYELLRHSPVTLYHSREVLARHAEWLGRHQYLVHSFDCSGWASEEDFHTVVSQALAFPAYYGRNLAAFNDCLCAVEVPEDGGTALVFVAFDVFHRLSPEACWHVLDIIARWSRHFLLSRFQKVL
jgi:RNAse (barnase) inhibitor barstar